MAISIHALREESDIIILVNLYKNKDFNPRSPRGERPNVRVFEKSGMHFNPRSPRGERQAVIDKYPNLQNISIHALREESDQMPLYKCFNTLQISIHALREESDNYDDVEIQERIKISIHALREESDCNLICFF